MASHKMTLQHKEKERKFFSRYAKDQNDYNVFTNKSTDRLLDECLNFVDFPKGGMVADIGCGSGIFTSRLAKKGFRVIGIDLSPELISVAKNQSSDLDFRVGDVEHLEIKSESLDGVFLGGLIHHLPDPTACAREVFRVLKPGARFVAFDPNRKNPFMFLYRDRTSPFYSNKGVTENERPILASEVQTVFNKAGFKIHFRYLSGLHYQYVESKICQIFLPIYNFVDHFLCCFAFPKSFAPFVLTRGIKNRFFV